MFRRRLFAKKSNEEIISEEEEKLKKIMMDNGITQELTNKIIKDTVPEYDLEHQADFFFREARKKFIDKEILGKKDEIVCGEDGDTHSKDICEARLDVRLQKFNYRRWRYWFAKTYGTGDPNDFEFRDMKGFKPDEVVDALTVGLIDTKIKKRKDNCLCHVGIVTGNKILKELGNKIEKYKKAKQPSTPTLIPHEKNKEVQSNSTTLKQPSTPTLIPLKTQPLIKEPVASQNNTGKKNEVRGGKKRRKTRRRKRNRKKSTRRRKRRTKRRRKSKRRRRK